MDDRYVVEIVKEGKTPAENLVCCRLQMEESRIQAYQCRGRKRRRRPYRSLEYYAHHDYDGGTLASNALPGRRHDDG